MSVIMPLVIPVFIPHQGCPHRCVFCNQNATSGKKSKPTKNEIINTIETYLNNINDSIENVEIAFFGGSFTGLPIDDQSNYLKIASKYFLEKKINGIRLSTRPDYIDSKILDLLKKFNVTTIELGIQSFNDKVLTKSNRGHTSSDSIKAIETIKNFNFKFVIQLMPGLPGSTEKTIIQSAKIAAELKPDAVRIYPVVVLKDTILEKMYREKLFKPLDLEEAIEICTDLYSIFIKQNISIIRLGLHPFSDDEIKNIVTGPYHPAFGFLVKSRLRRYEMEELINQHWIYQKNLQGIDITIPEKNKEEYIGIKKNNMIYLKNRFNLRSLNYSIEGNKLHITF